MDLPQKIDSITMQVNQHFATLTHSQLNWKPTPSQWSIAQCLDHIIVSNTTYFPIFDQLLQGQYKLSLFQRLNPFKKSFGPMMVRTLGPGIPKKFISPKIFEPSASDIHPGIVNDFIQHQEKLKNYFKQLSAMNGTTTVIASPVSSMITYSLDDALQIIAGHEQRHVNQALHILNNPNFPQS